MRSDLSREPFVDVRSGPLWIGSGYRKVLDSTKKKMEEMIEMTWNLENPWDHFNITKLLTDQGLFIQSWKRTISQQ